MNDGTELVELNSLRVAKRREGYRDRQQAVQRLRKVAVFPTTEKTKQIIDS